MTKYRYKLLVGDVGQRVRELVRQTCDAFEIRIIKGVVSKDHVHILVSAPPEMAPSEIMLRINNLQKFLSARASSEFAEDRSPQKSLKNHFYYFIVSIKFGYRCFIFIQPDDCKRQHGAEQHFSGSPANADNAR